MTYKQIFIGGTFITVPDEPAAEPVQKPDTRVYAIALMRRMTQEERIAIRNLAKANDVAFDFMDLLDKAPNGIVHLDDRDLVAGINTMEAAGKLAKGRAQEILSAPIQPGERP